MVHIPQGDTLVDDMFRLGTKLYLLVAFIVNLGASRSVDKNGAEIIGTRSGRHFVTYARSSCYPCAPWARYDDAEVVSAVSSDAMRKARATQQANGKTAFPCASSLLILCSTTPPSSS